jgi:hypothetical protein
MRVGSNLFMKYCDPQMKPATIHGTKMKGVRAITTLRLLFPLLCTSVYGQRNAELEERIVISSH